MSDIREILDALSETVSASARLEETRQDRPTDEILRINTEAVEKRRKDLARRLDRQLAIKQADLVEYQIIRSSGSVYPARAVGAAMVAFQELVTAIFDAIRTSPKRRYTPSAENIEFSTLDFAAARSGSVVVSLTVPNERLLLIQSEMDRAFEYVARILSVRSGSGFKELVGEIGVASISRAYSWADASSSYGLDTFVQWGKSYSEKKELSISRTEALLIKEIIEEVGEETYEYTEHDCVLVGIDGDTSYFHVKADDGLDIRGNLASDFPQGRQWTTNAAYRARLRKATSIKYATGEEKTFWSLASLNELK